MTSKNNDDNQNKNIKEENDIQDNNNQLNFKLLNAKFLLIKLLQKNLDSSLLKLESKSSQDFSNLKIIKKNFNDFSKKIHTFNKKVEETLKKREKEKINKPSKRNDKKRISYLKKRTLSSNSIKISFNKRCKTIIYEDEIEKMYHTSKNFNKEERGKIFCSNNLGLRTISNFRTSRMKEKEKEKKREKEKMKQIDKRIEIKGYKKQQKNYKDMNLKKYKTSNKGTLKNDNINQNENITINNIKEINVKKNDMSWTNNYRTKSDHMPKEGNYSFDKIDGITNSNIMFGNSLSYIEEKIEKKNIINSNIIRKNNFKIKEDKEKYFLNKIQKNENKNVDQINNMNLKFQNHLTNDNSKNKNINTEPSNISKTIFTGNEINISKTISNITNGNNNNDKKDNKIVEKVENIVKLVDDVNQNINKILIGSQAFLQKRNSCKRESSKSFAFDKRTDLKEYLSNLSPEFSIIEIEKENEKTKNNNDIPSLNVNKVKNLNVKCKNNNNMLPNENNTKKLYKKIKINKEKNNNFSVKNINIDIKKTNYNSHKNHKIIKKILLQADNYKNNENEKNNIESIDIQNTPNINREKKSKDLIKFKVNRFKEKNKKNNKLTFINIIENNPKILSTILQYLSFKNKINFLSINKFLSKERISLLINKKDEIFLILHLKENETIDDKIKKLKNLSNNNNKGSFLNKLKEFKLSKDAINNLKLLNNSQIIKLFKENQIDNNKIAEINIIYKVLLLLFREKKLVEISDDIIFWKNCCKYFFEKSEDGKIGNYIINQSKNFCFDHKTINLIEFVLIGNKNNIINGYYDKLCKTTELILPLIKQALEYCGVIYTDKKNNLNKILDNLQYNQMLINKLDNIINFYTNK